MTARDPAALREVARLFLRLGITAFGGPAAHIAMMRDEVVRRRRWVDDARFLDLLGATNLIPGPNSTEMAIHWATCGGLGRADRGRSPLHRPRDAHCPGPGVGVCALRDHARGCVAPLRDHSRRHRHRGAGAVGPRADGGEGMAARRDRNGCARALSVRGQRDRAALRRRAGCPGDGAGRRLVAPPCGDGAPDRHGRRAAGCGRGLRGQPHRPRPDLPEDRGSTAAATSCWHSSATTSSTGWAG
jgi:hypothetical protein